MAQISPLWLDLVNPAWVAEVPSPPHDALSPEDRQAHIKQFPLSYLSVTRAPEDVTPEEPLTPEELLELGRQSLDELLDHEVFDLADAPGFFVYRLSAQGHTQTGLVCGVAVADYDSGLIRVHERTKQDRALHLARHLEVVSAQSSPIALAAGPSVDLARQLNDLADAAEPNLDFTSADGLRQQIWAVSDDKVHRRLTDALADEPLYLIDGHHRAAAASVHRASTIDFGGLTDDADDEGPVPAPTPGIDWMLSVIFPIDQLKNQAFHRVLAVGANPDVADQLLSGATPASANEVANRSPSQIPIGSRSASGELQWHLIDLPLDTNVDGPAAILANLDAVRIQQQILEPKLGIDETRPVGRLQHRAGTSVVDGSENDAGTLIQPGEVVLLTRQVTMEQLMTASDNGLVMPPKSTYFLPKVRSGVFLHRKVHV